MDALLDMDVFMLYGAVGEWPECMCRCGGILGMGWYTLESTFRYREFSVCIDVESGLPDVFRVFIKSGGKLLAFNSCLSCSRVTPDIFNTTKNETTVNFLMKMEIIKMKIPEHTNISLRRLMEVIGISKTRV